MRNIAVSRKNDAASFQLRVRVAECKTSIAAQKQTVQLCCSQLDAMQSPADEVAYWHRNCATVQPSRQAP
ncbi:MAG: hypothetical protein WBP85_03770 [Terracidiphilus sp.]